MSRDSTTITVRGRILRELRAIQKQRKFDTLANAFRVVWEEYVRPNINIEDGEREGRIDSN